MKKETAYDNALIRRLFYSLMPAAIVIMLANSANSIVDGLVAGNFAGNVSIAAIGYYSPLNAALIGISAIFSGGSLILTGNCLGKGDSKGACTVFSTDLLVTSVIFLFLSFFLFFSAPWLAQIADAGDAAYDETVRYIRGIAFSVLPFYVANHLNLYLELEQRHVRNYIGVACMVIFNAVADIICVKDLHMGCLGLGLATTVSSWIYFFILSSYYLKSRAQLKFSRGSADFSLLSRIVRLGFPGAVIQIYLAVKGYIYNSYITGFAGDDGMAAFSAVNSFSCIFYAFTYGINTVCGTLFSLFAGSRDRKSMVTVMRVALFRAFPINVALSCIFCMLADVFTRFYYSDPSSQVYQLALSLFRICPYAVSFAALPGIFTAAYQSQGKTAITNVMSFVNGFLGVVLSLLILAPLLGIEGVWLSWLTNIFFAMIPVICYTLGKLKRWPRTLEDWLVLGDGFGVSDSERLNFSIHSEDEVIYCSEQVINFLELHGKDRRLSYYTGLAVEEMAGNIISHGYKKDGKRHHAVVECVDAGDRTVLHIMDDCRAFDPLSKDLLFNPADPAKNIGIRMVQGIADELKYYRMIDINVLTITING